MRLELLDVSVAPPGAPQPVLEGFSLAVDSGEWVALGGPNGSGKTTLLLVAAGLRPPRGGARRIEGTAPAGAPRNGVRANGDPIIATLLQDPSSQLLRSTVAEEIAMSAENLGVSPAEIDAETRHVAERLGLSRDLQIDPRTLSAGRQQLVLLASSLVGRPDFLIADEPGAHLDLESRARVLGLVRDRVRGGMGVLWATQDSIEAAAADRRLAIGGSFEPAPREAVPAIGTPGGERLVLEVAPDRGAPGPRVRTHAGFVVRLPESGVVALTGPNGAGKSVLLGAAVGVIDCPQVRRAMAPDRPGILVGQYPELQIFEDGVAAELRYAAEQRGRNARETVDEARAILRRLGLGASFLERRTWELSAGEKRLVLLVAALVAPASFLALDEPTAGLDASRKAALAEILARQAQSTPILLASQDPGWLGSLGASVLPIPDE